MESAIRPQPESVRHHAGASWPRHREGEITSVSDIPTLKRYRLLNPEECTLTFDRRIETVETADTVNLSGLPGWSPSYRTDITNIVDVVTIRHGDNEDTITLHRPVIQFDSDRRCIGLESDLWCLPMAGDWAEEGAA